MASFSLPSGYQQQKEYCKTNTNLSKKVNYKTPQKYFFFFFKKIKYEIIEKVK